MAAVLWPSELLGRPGVYRFLELLGKRDEFERDSLNKSLVEAGVEEATFRQLVEAGLFRSLDETRVCITTLGSRARLLLDALNGADVPRTMKRLARFDTGTAPYEIVTEGMTGAFIDGLASNSDFKHVYICSPWINLREKLGRKLMYAIYRAQGTDEGARIRITVIAQPLKKESDQYEQYLKTFQLLVRLGAEVVVNRRLHAKLYIREPNPRGRLLMAIFGSENLTGTHNIELGIRITNDTSIINKLIRYFLEIYSTCEPFREA